ncbi:MAG: SDR family oxidoreductase [bacterium]|nr:SDR family oxidoreductase [Gammaproteobacteria bacterium]HIL97813.1 SDR family oxidoreductase [Pseudomonadales bacterium]
MSADNRKSILITGGGGGMGLETGRYFAARGWFVGLLDTNEPLLAEAERSLKSQDIFTRRLDVTDEVDFTATVSEFSRHTNGTLDIMYNNAGIAPGGWFDDMSMDTIRQIIDINVYGVINGIRAALPLLKATENSLCISTSSSVATYGHGFRAVYSASKFAVKGLTEALSLEFERFGIRTADVLPGCIDTPMLRQATAARTGRPFDESMLAGLPKAGPYRLMPAVAIAEAVWQAYQNSDQIHFYVPQEVGDTDKLKANDITAAREETRAFLFDR